MNKEKFVIDYPDDREIKIQIKKIVNEGLPKSESFSSHLIKVYKEIGLKHVFRDITELVFLLLLVASILLYLIASAKQFFNSGNENIFTFIFIISPLLFLISCMASFEKLRQEKTLEIEMTCKYNVFQLAAFRMLVFSIFTLVLNAVVITIIVKYYEQIDFLLAFLISASSLLLYSLLYLAVLLKVRTKGGRISFAFIWLVINLMLLIFSKDFYQLLLQNIPFYLYLILIIFGAFLYIKSLKKLFFIKSPEGVF